MSPMQKALKRLRTIGYTVGITEHWNPFSKHRQDLYGCIDLIAMRQGEPLLAIQVTSNTNVSGRMAKSHDVAHDWVSTGNRFEVWGWTPKSKKPPRVMVMTGAGEWVAVKELE